MLYTRPDIYYTEKPYVNQPSGTFYLNDKVGNLTNNASISISGIIQIYPNIDVGYYILTTLYYLNQSFNTFDTTVINKPEFTYQSNSIINFGYGGTSDLPLTYPNGGQFYLYDTSYNNLLNQSNINLNTGIISFNSTIDVGIYIYMVNRIYFKFISHD